MQSKLIKLLSTNVKSKILKYEGIEPKTILYVQQKGKHAKTVENYLMNLKQDKYLKARPYT